MVSIEDIIKEHKIDKIRDKELIVRAYNTLMSNVYPTEGFLWSPYRCISPGKNNFPGIWNWDSAFHAAGVSRWDTKLAKESIVGFLQFQREDGLIPDVIWENGVIESSFSKPPLFAWAAEIIYNRDKDISFIQEVYPKLVKNAEYWLNNRCCNGLFFYDADNKSAEDYLKRVKFESGWDNSVRWDNDITKYWAIDLNCFMIMFYRSLSFMAKLLNLCNDSDMWSKKALTLAALINTKMWDSQKGYYADTNKFTEELSDTLSPASFMPLYIGIATDEQAKAMEIVARDKFRCKMPTVSFDNPEYSNDYWRGPTWLNVAYFAAKGLKRYGFDVADRIKESVLNMCHTEKDGIFENYDSLTGKGLCCNHFSWSCVFILEFILNW